MSIFPQNDFKQPEGLQPEFYRYPVQSNRSGWLPVWTPTMLVVPKARDANGNQIPGTEVWGVSFYVEASSVAPVAGHDHVGIYNPDYNVYRVDIPSSQLSQYKIDLTNPNVKFYRVESADTYKQGVDDGTDGVAFYRITPDGDYERLLEGLSEARDGDYIEYMMHRGVLGRVKYYAGAEYYDFSTVEIPTEELPRGHYKFIWEARFKKRLYDGAGNFQCIGICTEEDQSGCGLATLAYHINHPGEIIADMYDKTPEIFFDNTNKSEDRTLGLYRPIAEALQDIFDEQNLLHGINWVHKIPVNYMPYLAYLIGVDLPNFNSATIEYNERMRKVMLRRGVNLQKYKGSKYAIIELLRIFGLAAKVVQCWCTTDGKRFIAPDENLPVQYGESNTETGTQEITTTELCHTDPLVLNFDTDGFNNFEVPLIYPSVDAIVSLDAFLVDKLPQWESKTHYNVGDIILPTTAIGLAARCITEGDSGESEPTWSQNENDIIIDNAVKWQMVRHAAAELGLIQKELLNDPDSLEDPVCRTDEKGYYIPCAVIERLTNDGTCLRVLSKFIDGVRGYSRLVLNDIKLLKEEHDGVSPFKPDITVQLRKEHYQYHTGDYIRNTIGDGVTYKALNDGMSGNTEPSWDTSVGRITIDGSVRWLAVAEHFQYVERPSQGSVVFDRRLSQIKASFAKYFTFDNTSLYVFATYKRSKINLPHIHQITDLRTNRFDVYITESEENTDISTYKAVLDFILRYKAFHSLLRKLSITKEFVSVYNTNDFCFKGSIPGSSNHNYECLQIPPPTAPECDGEWSTGVCEGTQEKVYAGTEADIQLRNRIAEALKSEYEAWRRLNGTRDLSDEQRDLLQAQSAVYIPKEDHDGWNYRGQDRLTYAFLLKNLGFNGIIKEIPSATIIQLKVVVTGDIIKLEGTYDGHKQQFEVINYPWINFPQIAVGSFVVVQFRYQLDNDQYYTIADIDVDHPYTNDPSHVTNDPPVDPRAKVTDVTLSPLPSYCYNARIRETPAFKPNIQSLDTVKCGPCVNLGDGVYYSLVCDSAIEPACWYTLDDPPTLHYDGFPFLGRLCTGDAAKPSLNIERTNLLFPGHRFIRMNGLEHDFTHDTWNSRPWDFDADPCIPMLRNPLNARVVESGEFDCCGEPIETLIFDHDPLTYRGNGYKPDINDLSGDTELLLTHAIYTTASDGPYVEDSGQIIYGIEEDTLDYTVRDTIDTECPIFSSARRCSNDSAGTSTDLIDGYPSRYGSFKISAAQFWSYRSYCDNTEIDLGNPFYCGLNGTDNGCEPSIMPDVDDKEYTFKATLSSAVPTDLEEYAGLRLDCGGEAVACTNAEPAFSNIPLYINEHGALDTHCDRAIAIPILTLTEEYDTDTILDECMASSGAENDDCLEIIVNGEDSHTPWPTPPPPCSISSGAIGFKGAWGPYNGDIVR